MSKIDYIFPIFLVAMFTSSLSFAQQIGRALTIPAKKIICPNGNVQYTPCLPATLPRLTSTKKTRSIPLVQKATSSVSVINRSFTTINQGEGLWQGFVTGRGLLDLTLLIYTNGKLVESRYIGQVRQELKDKPTKFTFKSNVPRHREWTWDVIAKTL